ncbi:hydrolase [Erysipelotrichaceae bacterium]|nr:hydrolase [Erysipelotrichaceae bacterium]
MKLVAGITLMHEHTRIDLSGLKKNDDCNLNCFEQTIKEYKELYQQGVRNIVDVTNIGMGGDAAYVQKVAKASNINIIHATGFYQDKFLPPIVFSKTVEQLAQIMIDQIEIGIDGTSAKADIIGEIGTSKNEMTAAEQKVFKAAMLASRKTGKPLTTHTTLGTYGKEQVAFFKEHDFPLNMVMIGHVDLTGDTEYVLDLLKEGVYVELDTVGKHNYMADAVRLEMLKEIEEQGFENRVCLSLDITRKSQLKYLGGIGYTYMLDTFIPYLRASGLSERFIEKMLIENPQRFFEEKSQ